MANSRCSVASFGAPFIVVTIALVACRSAPAERPVPPATTAALHRSFPVAPRGSAQSRAEIAPPWRGKRLHVWITDCHVDSQQRDALADVAKRFPSLIDSVGVACHTLRADGTLEAAGRIRGGD